VAGPPEKGGGGGGGGGGGEGKTIAASLGGTGRNELSAFKGGSARWGGFAGGHRDRRSPVFRAQTLLVFSRWWLWAHRFVPGWKAAWARSGRPRRGWGTGTLIFLLPSAIVQLKDGPGGPVSIRCEHFRKAGQGRYSRKGDPLGDWGSTLEDGREVRG